jgi:hypothetical protein
MIAPLAYRRGGYVLSCCRNGNLTRLALFAAKRPKGHRAILARQSRAASCYTTVGSVAALGYLGAVHKRESGAKNGAVA